MILSADERFTDDDFANDDTPLPHIEPIFWGSSDILIHDFARTMKLIDFAAVMVHASANGTMLDAAEQLDLQVMFDALSRLDEHSEYQIRSSYGYFPVIGEKEGFVILDPDDFHSELLALPGSKLTQKGQDAAKRLSPDGDIIAVGAVSFGPVVKILEQLTENKPAKKLSSLLITALENVTTKRLAAELRRGLGIERGDYVSCDSIIADQALIKTIFEFMSFEERLGIEYAAEPTNSIISAHSGLFFHHF